MAASLALPASILGAIWYAAALGCWGLASGLIRYAATDMPALQLGFLRALFGALLMLPWLLPQRISPVPRRHTGLYLVRGLLEATAIATWFAALGLMQAADVVALGFTLPLFATLLAALFLGERIRLRRGLAILVGLFGAILIMRPTGQDVTWAAVLPIVTSIAAAASRIISRKLAQRGEPMVTLVASLGFITAPLLLPLSFWTWEPFTVAGVLLGLLIAALSLVGHVFMVRALRLEEASALVPYEFTQLLVAVAFGMAVLGERPDAWTWAGSAIILASAVYIVRREAALARQRAKETQS
jgi:drug/metabolite transporter (DMT)-like permease